MPAINGTQYRHSPSRYTARQRHSIPALTITVYSLSAIRYITNSSSRYTEIIMISYQTDQVKMPAIRRRDTSAWIKAVAASYGKRVGSIAYIFCNDDKILEVNRQYLQHDYYTDIITFDYCDDELMMGKKDTISGDLFISLDTVHSNAEQQGTTYEEELHRVIIHGVLHLCGINDKGPGEREIMEAAENKALALLKEN